MKKKYLIPAVIIGLILLFVVIRMSRSSVVKSGILIKPRFGTFIVDVTTTGELQAKNSISVRGPDNARRARIWNMQIADLVPEGTIVKAGDFVASLDKSELDNTIQESQINLNKLESQLIQAKLDSSLTLSMSRNDIINLQYNLEQKQLLVDQSTFEAPAIQRQAGIELEKAERALVQARKNYETKVQQAIEKIKVVEADYSKEQKRHESYLQLLDDFTITAPENGMVIYAREWNGKKKIVGSTVSGWDPVVATLPDLSVMESLTYVNEVDIQKIQTGQSVEVSLDADPSKKLTGTVTHVANIGEQRPNSDSKVFEVKIEILESDTTLRPSMTTSNRIEVTRIDSVLYVPLECIHTLDSLAIVYKKTDGTAVKQEIKRGLVNDEAAIIRAGLTVDDEIFLSIPENTDDLKLQRLTD
ncbi:MAG: HlyD family efflux transporter periplasmic adaptor subunit [FCB group bacterium]|nr:HlyD family efflux transporter periplasmic adaptor subunit [FCB group bacterium]